jgi:hypothetical protein
MLLLLLLLLFQLISFFDIHLSLTKDEKRQPQAIRVHRKMILAITG